MNIDEHSLQQEAVETLSFIAATVQYQADIVRFALAVGIPKQQIHQLTGLARTTIDRMASQSAPYSHPCDYCLHEHFQQLRKGGAAQPVRDSHGYLLYRIGRRPEIVAQKLCEQHRQEDWEQKLPASARRTWCPHMPNTPSAIVYSLGGIRDDSDMFRAYFGNFPEWNAKIRPLLGSVNES